MPGGVHQPWGHEAHLASELMWHPEPTDGPGQETQTLEDHVTPGPPPTLPQGVITLRPGGVTALPQDTQEGHTGSRPDLYNSN